MHGAVDLTALRADNEIELAVDISADPEQRHRGAGSTAKDSGKDTSTNQREHLGNDTMVRKDISWSSRA